MGVFVRHLFCISSQSLPVVWHLKPRGGPWHSQPVRQSIHVRYRASGSSWWLRWSPHCSYSVITWLTFVGFSERSQQLGCIEFVLARTHVVLTALTLHLAPSGLSCHIAAGWGNLKTGRNVPHSCETHHILPPGPNLFSEWTGLNTVLCWASHACRCVVPVGEGEGLLQDHSGSMNDDNTEPQYKQRNYCGLEWQRVWCLWVRRRSRPVWRAAQTLTSGPHQSATLSLCGDNPPRQIE